MGRVIVGRVIVGRVNGNQNLDHYINGFYLDETTYFFI